MRIHHLNCGSMCPHGRRLFEGQGGLFEAGNVVCHCLLIESAEGLVLVDSGLSTADLDPKRSRIPASLRALMRPVLDPAQSALHQVHALGFHARDVRHIVATHLDFDHAGGISDFPEAAVHVFTDELTAARNPDWREKRRYLRHCWAHSPHFVEHALSGENFEGFESVRALSMRETDILLIPVRGHTRGHVVVAVRDGERHLVHCGDAYFHRNEMNDPPSCPIGFEVFQRLMAHDDSLRRKNQARLHALKQRSRSKLALFSAHDPVEFAQFRERPLASAGERVARSAP
jgi:glyoxylase-like metal-dependent hydrolase (beta-lactamase superfamily II)